MTRKNEREDGRNNVLSAWNNFQPAETHLNTEEVETWLGKLETVLVAACTERESTKIIMKISD